MAEEDEETTGSSGFAISLPLSILTVFLGAAPFLEDSPDSGACDSATPSLDVSFVLMVCLFVLTSSATAAAP